MQGDLVNSSPTLDSLFENWLNAPTKNGRSRSSASLSENFWLVQDFLLAITQQIIDLLVIALFGCGDPRAPLRTKQFSVAEAGQ